MLTEGLNDYNAQRSIYGVLCNSDDCDDDDGDDDEAFPGQYALI